MKESDYTPHPIDTSDIELPTSLNPLIEQLSENVHEVWSQGRISQHWTYGPTRNDALKQHPGLRPYDELSEEEKAYDRNTAVSTLKFILKMGFKIVK